MNTVNRDITKLIYDKLNVIDRLKLGHVFNEQRPSQFKTAYEMLSKIKLKGDKGLFTRAVTTGDYEPCILSMLSIQKFNIKPENMDEYETDIRSSFIDYDDFQRIDRLKIHKYWYYKNIAL